MQDRRALTNRFAVIKAHCLAPFRTSNAVHRESAARRDPTRGAERQVLLKYGHILEGAFG